MAIKGFKKPKADKAIKEPEAAKAPEASKAVRIPVSDVGAVNVTPAGCVIVADGKAQTVQGKVSIVIEG